MNDFFPTTCIDNFFEDPDTIRKLATFFEYKPAEDGSWPGVRTENLYNLSNDFFNQFLSKFFRIFYNYDHEKMNWNASVYFQKTKPYFDDPELNVGWIHNDLPCVVGGLVYLTPENDPSSGTSIFSYSFEDKEPEDEIDDEQKKILYLNPDQVDKEWYKGKLKAYQNLFTETASFKNKYNRLVAYDGNTYHRADSFNGSEDSERLTLVFFVHEIESQTVPLMRNLDTYSF